MNRPLEILIIEDDKSDLERIQDALRKGTNPSNAHFVSTGEEALLYLYQQEHFATSPRPDLIYLDLSLPGIDGRNLLKQIKANRSFRHIPVLVFTSSDSEFDLVASYKAGANCYMVKPVDANTFGRVVTETFNFWSSTALLASAVKRPENKPQNLTAEAFSTLGSPERTMHVLCVEDSDADFDIISQNMKMVAHPPIVVHREILLGDAIRYAQNHVVDAVLLDLMLPDSSGTNTVVDFCVQLPNLPVVIMTGEYDATQGHQALQHGAVDYLTKEQVLPEYLGRTLTYAIERKANAIANSVALELEHDARSEAESAITVRDEFLSIAGHELRTPLSSLKLRAELLSRKLNKQASPQALSESQVLAAALFGEVDRICGLVDMLLDFSQAQSGQLKLLISKFDITEMIRMSVERLHAELQNVGCVVKLDLEKVIEGEWDRLRLEQVISNLISNAIRYAPGQPIEISATEEGDEVVVRIKDNGPGIAIGDQEAIFHRFKRLSNGKSVRGLGIGLYLVRQIVDIHRGHIQIKSQLGAGALFEIRLPKRLTLSNAGLT